MSQIENLSCHLLLRNISIKICLKSDLKQHFMLIFIDDGFFEALIWSDTLKYKKMVRTRKRNGNLLNLTLLVNSLFFHYTQFASLCNFITINKNRCSKNIMFSLKS